MLWCQSPIAEVMMQLIVELIFLQYFEEIVFRGNFLILASKQNKQTI